MKDRHRPEPQREVLSAQAGDRLLARAAELDAAQRAAVEIADLRAAAAEAGISSSAFDTALGEIHGEAQVPTVSSRRPRLRMALALGLVALLLLGAFSVLRVAVPPAIAVVEQSFLLRCLPPGEAAELLRPMLDNTSSVRVSPARAPRVLIVRTTPDQMGRIRALLNQQDGAACPVPPASTR